ncbi:MAG: hypothetical protein JOZ80_03670 [Acidobacteriaceae bacterium]|nr:hypothetical protein [Acidobacteriaceae bacterium]
MSRPWFGPILLLALLIPSADAKDKKKVLPAYVLQARTVLVVIDPDTGIDPAHPNANRIARTDVEAALLTWGRFTLVTDAQTADLVISVRHGNGKTVNSTIGGVPNDRPVIFQPSDSGIHVGAQQGRNTPITDPTAAPPVGAHPQTEIGSSEDSFVVYRGQVEYPLDAPPIWRYNAKDALNSPTVPAVTQFRKMIEETEKQLSQKKP